MKQTKSTCGIWTNQCAEEKQGRREREWTHQMNLINEQHDAASGLLDLIQHRLQALLKFTPARAITVQASASCFQRDNLAVASAPCTSATTLKQTRQAQSHTSRCPEDSEQWLCHTPVLCTRHERAHVQADQACVLQHFRHISPHDALSQALHARSL